jgi:hypothetical protein
LAAPNAVAATEEKGGEGQQSQEKGKRAGQYMSTNKFVYLFLPYPHESTTGILAYMDYSTMTGGEKERGALLSAHLPTCTIFVLIEPR